MSKRMLLVAALAASSVILVISAMQAVAEDQASSASASALAPASKPTGGKTWTPLGGLYDGNVTGFVEDGSGAIWAATAGNGVFKSADGGDTWTAFNDGLACHMVSTIAISPKSGDIFVGTTGHNGGVFKLAKGATSWQMLNTGFPKGYPDPVNIWISGLAFNKAGDLFGGNGGTWRLPADGNSWQAAGKVPAQAWKDFVQSAGGRIWASGSAHVASTTDDGANWTMATMPAPQVMCVAVDDAGGVVYVGGRMGKWGGKGGGVYRSTDDGKTWSKPALPNMQVNCMTVSGAKMFAGCRQSTDFGALYVSDDHGVTWTPVTKGLDDLWDVNSVVVTKHGMFVGANGTYRLTDGGVSFQKLNIPAVQYGGSIVVMDNGDIYTGGDMYGGFNAHGVSRLVHGTAKWTKLNNGLLSMDITCIIKNGKGELLASDKYQTTYRLIGNGETWTKSNMNVPLGAQELVLAANNDVLAGTASGPKFVSHDGGSTFEKLVERERGVQTNDFCLAPNGDILVAAEPFYLQISKDNGKTFENCIGSPPSAASAAWTVGATPTGTILVTTPGGTDEYLGDGKWRRASKGLAGTARDFILNKAKTKVFAATTEGVFYSTDGQNWQAFSDGLNPAASDVHSLAFDSHGYLYAGTESGLYKTATPQDK